MNREVLTRHRPVSALAAAIVMLGLAGAGALFVVDDPSPIERARQELADDASFTRTSDAGAAFTRASAHLQEAGERCGDEPRCDRMYTAAAFLRVAALQVLQCGRPGMFDMRATLRHYVDSLAAGADPVPPTTSC